MSDIFTPTPTVDPPEWDVITGKALLASKSPWGTLLGGAIGWLVARYGLGWDQTTSNLIAGLAVILAAYAMRAITNQPITGIVSARSVKYVRHAR